MPTHETVQPRALQRTSRLRAGLSSLLQYKSFLFNQKPGHTKIVWSKNGNQWQLSRRFTSSDVSSSLALPDDAPPPADPSQSHDTNAGPREGDGPSRESPHTSDTTADIEGLIVSPKPPGSIQWSQQAGQWRLTQRVSGFDTSSSPAIQEGPPQAAAPEPKVQDGQPKQPNQTPGDNDLSPAVREGCVRDPKGSFNINADDGPAIREGIWRTIVCSLGFSTEDISPQVREGAPRAANRSFGDSAGEGPRVREGPWRQPYMSPGVDVEVSKAMRAAADTLSNTADEAHGALIGPFDIDSFEEWIKSGHISGHFKPACRVSGRANPTPAPTTLAAVSQISPSIPVGSFL